MKNINDQALLDKLMKSKALIHSDATAKKVFEMLSQGADPICVIDEMLVHYTEIIEQYHHQLVKLIELSPRPITLEDGLKRYLTDEELTGLVDQKPKD